MALSTTVRSGATPPGQSLHVDLAPDLLTQLNDILTALAILAGGLFAYFKFFRGRVLNAGVSLEITGAMRPCGDQRRSLLGLRISQPTAGALVIRVTIRNNGQRSLKIPKDSDQLLSVSSITMEALARAGEDLNQSPTSWKQADAYFARANILLDDGEQPRENIKLEPGDVLSLAAAFAVPARHNAAAFLVVMNGYAESRGWFGRTEKHPEMRTLVVPNDGRQGSRVVHV
jgi:hypothetical protein